MAYYTTLKELRVFFREYNRKYFDKKLPEYKIKWSKSLWKFGYLGECDYDNKVISISLQLRSMRRIVKGTLIHEMVHAFLGPNYGHGPKFNKTMLHVAKKGGFRHLW